MPTTITHRPLAAIAVALLAICATHPAAASNPAALAPKFRAVVEQALRDCKIPGAAVGVYSGPAHWTAALGLADVARGVPVRLDDRFAIRSITKSFVVTKLLKLVARGRVGLDDAIANYYPGVPNGNRITLRNLANMTSGLFDYTRDPTWQAQIGADPLRRWTDRELIAFALTHPAKFQPGEEYDYSNTNTLLLGRVIAKVTGELVGPALEASIFKPLGLTSTAYLYSVSIPAPAVLGYQGFEAGRPSDLAVSFTGLGASGAMVATVSDLKLWGEALVDGALLPPPLQRQRFVARKATNGPEYDRYGLGMGEIDGWWGHTGSGAGFEAAVFHTPGRRDDTIVVLLNASNAHDVPAGIVRRLIRILDTGSEGIYRGKPVCS